MNVISRIYYPNLEPRNTQPTRNTLYNLEHIFNVYLGLHTKGALNYLEA